MGIWKHVKDVLPNAKWDMFKYIVAKLWEFGMLAVLVGIVQKIKDGNLDWWILGAMLLGSLVLMWVSSRFSSKNEIQAVSSQSDTQNGREQFSQFVLAQRFLRLALPAEEEHLVSVRILYASTTEDSFVSLLSSFFRLMQWQVEIQSLYEKREDVGLIVVGYNERFVRAVTDLLRTLGLSEAMSEVEALKIPQGHPDWDDKQHALRVIIGQKFTKSDIS